MSGGIPDEVEARLRVRRGGSCVCTVVRLSSSSFWWLSEAMLGTGSGNLVMLFRKLRVDSVAILVCRKACRSDDNGEADGYSIGSLNGSSCIECVV